MMRTHLSDEQLQGHVLDTVVDGDLALITDHLADCDRCQARHQEEIYVQRQLERELKAQLQQHRPSKQAEFVHILKQLPAAPTKPSPIWQRYLPNVAAVLAMAGVLLVVSLLTDGIDPIASRPATPAEPSAVEINALNVAYEGAPTELETDFSQLSAEPIIPNIAHNLNFENATLRGSTTGRDTFSGWFLSGPDARGYTMSRDNSTATEGEASARLTQKIVEQLAANNMTQDDLGYGAINQSVEAAALRGQRVWMSADVKTENLDSWAGLWARVDDSSGFVLQFDNMSGRPIEGTTDWERHHIVVDVPFNAQTLNFGILLNSTGTVWIDNVKFVSVGSNIPTTGWSNSFSDYAISDTPFFLDFEDGLRVDLSVEDRFFDGWYLSGNNASGYLALRDEQVRSEGDASARLVATEPFDDRFGQLVQTMTADRWIGKRVRLSADVKTQDVTNKAGLTLSVVDTNMALLAFDNMSNRPLVGALDWQRYDIVFDVPDDSTHISFGAQLFGDGILWLDNVTFEEVDDSVPVTADLRLLDDDTIFCGPTGTVLPLTPSNLDFECPRRRRSDIPRWFLNETVQGEFDIAVDESVTSGGENSGTLFAQAGSVTGSATLTQRIDPKLYLGQQVRISADIRAENLDAPAYLWAGVDRADAADVVTERGLIENSAEWQRIEVYLIIPDNSPELDYGLLLNGSGQIWLDNVTVERIERPTNLSFESLPQTTRRIAGDSGLDGWVTGGSLSLNNYMATRDTTTATDGEASVRFESVSENTNASGNLFQVVLAEPYIGQRLRISADVKAEDIVQSATFYVIVADDSGTPLFTNLPASTELQPIEDWQRTAIVFDVPPQSTLITFGISINGTGTVWLDNITFESVNSTVPTTTNSVSE